MSATTSSMAPGMRPRLACRPNDPPRAWTLAELGAAAVSPAPDVPAAVLLKLRAGDTAPNPRKPGESFAGPCRVTFYRYACGEWFTGAPDRSGPNDAEQDASGDEVYERIACGGVRGRSAAMAWLDRVGCFPSEDPATREITRAAHALLRYGTAP